MMIIKLQISAVVELEFKPENYPAGYTMEQALELELERASSDPHEYIAMLSAVTSVEGRLLSDNGQPLIRRSLDGWGQQAARAS